MKIQIKVDVENEAAMKYILEQISSTVFRGDTTFFEVTRIV